MSALHPNPQVTTGLVPLAVAPAPARAVRPRREQGSIWDGPPHGAAQLGVAIIAVACGLFAVNLAILGIAWAALPVAVLTVGLLVGAFLPDVLAARWDRQRAAEDAEAGA